MKKCAGLLILLAAVLFLTAGTASANQLHDAVVIRDVAKAKALLDKKPKLINSTEVYEGNALTPLQLAVQCRSDDVRLEELLISRGAKVNIADNFGMTPLHWAAMNQSEALVNLLVKHGANARAKTKNGETPLDLAKKEKNQEIIKTLKAFAGVK